MTERESEKREREIFFFLLSLRSTEWVPKSWSFVKLHEVENFHTLVISSLKAIFGTVWAKFLGLFSDSPDRIFWTIFGQSRTVLRFSFHPGTDVLGFCCVFWYHCNLLMNGTKKKKKVHDCEGTKMFLVLYGSEIVCIVGKINNMRLCVKIMLICACVMYY